MNQIEKILDIINNDKYKIIKRNYKIEIYNKKDAVVIYLLKNILKKDIPTNHDIKKSIKKIIRDISIYGHNCKNNISWKKLNNCLIVVNDNLYNNFLLKEIEDCFIVNIKETDFYNNLKFTYYHFVK